MLIIMLFTICRIKICEFVFWRLKNDDSEIRSRDIFHK